MILGVDVSTYLEQQRIAKSKYFDNGKEIDPFKLFKDNGVTHIRTRIWNNPYDEDGNEYLAGTCDLKNFLELAKVLEPYGFKHVVDFHYSDFWADPAKQFLPKAWEGLSLEELVKAVYDFTKESLTTIKENNIDVDYVQIGNEITNGMLWPFGQFRDDTPRSKTFENLSNFLKAGIKAAKEVYPNIKIIIHLERSYDQEGYREYLNEILKNGVKLDVLGTSYYPFWHHSFEEYFANMDMVQREFNIPVLNAELGYPFTTEDYRKDESGKAKHLVINADNIEDFMKMMPFYPDAKGQAEFVKEFLRLAKLHNLQGAFYWEPLWIPGEGICWASKAGQKYQHDESKDTRNEWANQCMFDYQGNKLPSADAFSSKNAK